MMANVYDAGCDGWFMTLYAMDMDLTICDASGNVCNVLMI